MEIRVSALNKYYGKNWILKDIDFTFPSGGLTSLLGESGCGKTTLLRVIAGLEGAQSGSVDFGDRRVFSFEENINIPSRLRNIGFVFQDFALWPHMTVKENVSFGFNARGLRGREGKVQEAIERVRLKGLEDRYPHELSGGQQQRVSFARALCTEPDLILLDEPFSALDQNLRLSMREEVKGIINDYKVTTIFVTHDQEEAMSMSDTIVLMDKGEIIQSGPPEDLYNNPINSKVMKFIGYTNWLNDNEGLRPEDIIIVDGKGKEEAKVLTSNFTGIGYEVKFLRDGRSWKLYSQKRFLPGDKISYSWDENKIKKFTGV